MSFVINPQTLNVLCLFGIFPYRYNYRTQTIDCSVFRLIYTGVYFIVTPVSIDYKLVVYISSKLISKKLTTYEIAKIIENIARSIIHNLCLVHVILRRHSYVNFLNNLNHFQCGIESELGCKVGTKIQYASSSLTVILSLIVYMLLISVVTCVINWTYPLASITYFFYNLSFLLVGADICNLNRILLKNYEYVFRTINSLIKKVAGNGEKKRDEDTSRRLIKCFVKLEQLEGLKLKFSDLFGPQILLVVAFNFTIITIAFYFLLFPSIFTYNNDGFAILRLVIFNSPSVVILGWMVVIMDKLGQQVNKMKKYALMASAIEDKRISESIELFLLKLQRMNKQKYVTANDYFPVNYRMLYNMSTAIITHMMIIIQFEQWEQSQQGQE